MDGPGVAVDGAQPNKRGHCGSPWAVVRQQFLTPLLEVAGAEPKLLSDDRYRVRLEKIHSRPPEPIGNAAPTGAAGAPLVELGTNACQSEVIVSVSFHRSFPFGT